MKEIILILYDWCFDFHYTPKEDAEEIYCKALNIKIVKELDDFYFYHNELKVDVKNILKKLDTIFSDYITKLENLN